MTPGPAAATATEAARPYRNRRRVALCRAATAPSSRSSNWGPGRGLVRMEPDLKKVDGEVAEGQAELPRLRPHLRTLVLADHRGAAGHRVQVGCEQLGLLQPAPGRLGQIQVGRGPAGLDRRG